MRILITGANGMVGRNLTEHAMSSRHELLLPTRRQLDLLNAASVSAYVRTHSPQLIVHAAGRVGGIQANIANPAAFLVENWDMGRNVLLAAHELNSTQVLNLGSSCMYPKDMSVALEEEMILSGPLEPTNEGYALAKISVARLATYLNKELGSARYKTIVPCNLYGRHDNFDPTTSHLVAAAITKVHQAKAEKRDTVNVWGDGTARREFMYAGDLADFIWHAVERFHDLPALMNVGTGADHTVNEYYQAALAAAGCSATLAHDLSKPVGMMRKLVATRKLQNWGWQPSTSLAAGMQSAYAFYLAHHA